MSKTVKVNRREFIATAGAASLSFAAGLPAITSAASKRKSASAPDPNLRHVIASEVAHTSGIPLGGIGSGAIEIRPDGYFQEWHIFNLGSWAPDQPKEEPGRQPELAAHSLGFFLRRSAAGKEPQLRRLGIREDQNDLYSLGWAKNVAKIEYEGQFPAARLTYIDPSLDLETSAIFFGPFVPHQAQVSGTPGFHGLFTIKNTSKETVEVSLMARLQNPLAWGFRDRMLKNELESGSGMARVTFRTAADDAPRQTLGSMSYSLSGGKPSWIIGDFMDYLWNGTWVGKHYGYIQESILREFRETGSLPSLSGDTCPAGELKLEDDAINALSAAEKRATIERLAKYPSTAVLLNRIREVDAKQFDTEEGLNKVLADLKVYLDRYAGKERTDSSWGHSALCNTITLAPGETKELTFNLAWYFPHHYSGEGPEMGHMYEKWFKDAAEVSRFLSENVKTHAQEVAKFRHTLWDTDCNPVLPAAWAAQLSTLTKCTWWTKANRFAVWEGYGCCGFHTMDITYQGSFSILALFPELQQSQMRMGTEFQRADGRVAHFFTPDLLHVDNGFDRVDMNPQFVMLVCRDYLWTGDRDYLQRVFPHVVRAIENSAKLDTDGDGLPDHDTRRNTYDNWNFFGAPSYIASLWLGSLLAGERMARDIGQPDVADRWKAIREKGSESFEKLLWNGEYYSLWVDGQNRDECCMSDQLSGVWFSNLIGMGTFLPQDRVHAALKSVLKHNYSHETGLVNATYPKGQKKQFSTFKNAQATACWTGVEYAFASMLLDHGLAKEGEALVDAIHDRYLRAGRYWNHVECGDHYYRAMASWSTLLAATGFKVDVPGAAVTFRPAVEATKLPWFSSHGYGSFSRNGSGLSVSCVSGVLTAVALNMPKGMRVSSAKLDGRSVSIESSEPGTVRFSKPVTVLAGQTLAIEA